MCAVLEDDCPHRKDSMTFVFLQGMVEVVAENYHNIWAKKKKSELVSKGVLLCSLGGGAVNNS